MTDFLYSRPSIIESVGRNMDFFGSMNSYDYSYPMIGEDADTAAIVSDLTVVYEDFYKAYNRTLCQFEAEKAADQ
ncbi:MAG: hypothetical protein FWD88_05700 [Treponema sp.]|nr:hypothetical protein [Treponema sp.]